MQMEMPPLALVGRLDNIKPAGDLLREDGPKPAEIGADLLHAMAPEIFEMDINPLLGTKDKVVAVDARIRIEKK